jgi:2'-5' RNA ligase
MIARSRGQACRAESSNNAPLRFADSGGRGEDSRNKKGAVRNFSSMPGGAISSKLGGRMNENRADPASIRCFVALPLPAEIKETLIQEQNRLRAAIGRGAVRWVDPSQMHVTLRFFGNIIENQSPEVTETLGRIAMAAASFRLETGRLGRFPETGLPKVIWIGLGGDLHELKRLQEAIEHETRSWGDHAESKLFQPHLTVGRVKSTHRRELDALVAAMADRRGSEPSAWTASAIEFIQSTLTPTGPAYECLAELPLGRAVAPGGGC